MASNMQYPIISKNVIWTEIAFKLDGIGGVCVVPKYQCYLASQGEIQFKKKKDFKADHSQLNLKELTAKYNFSIGILLKSTPLQIPGHKNKMYKVLTVFSDYIFKGPQLTETEKKVLFKENHEAKRLAIILTDKTTNKIIYVALHGKLGFFRKESKAQKLHAIGMASLNDNGFLTKENTMTEIDGKVVERRDGKKTEPNLPTAFQIEWLQNTQLLRLKDESYSSLVNSILNSQSDLGYIKESA